MSDSNSYSTNLVILEVVFTVRNNFLVWGRIFILRFIILKCNGCCSSQFLCFALDITGTERIPIVIKNDYPYKCTAIVNIVRIFMRMSANINYCCNTRERGAILHSQSAWGRGTFHLKMCLQRRTKGKQYLWQEVFFNTISKLLYKIRRK